MTRLTIVLWFAFHEICIEALRIARKMREVRAQNAALLQKVFELEGRLKSKNGDCK